MRFTSTTSLDGVTERLFTLGDIPGVLWTPDDAAGPRPLILMGHGGGRHKQAPDIVAHARRFAAEGGFAVVAVDAPHHGERPKGEEFGRVLAGLRAGMVAGGDNGGPLAAMHEFLSEQSVPEWRAVLDAVQDLDFVGAGPVGYWGMSMGCGLGVPFVAAEPRVRAAVLGLLGVHGLAEAAARITVPVRFLLQWDDDLVPREQGLALFDALATAGKTLHANPGKHGEVPAFETDSSLRFLMRHLG
ncbi:alpha/beta hydrolase [Nonomuraea sp. PA05]|uniref:dienelactone hydrolase family protein n=1 Tax=Nonomuraea sp. PA05 TaxID=2604466 RepID=UPI0011DA05C0|nr:alpha/beta hydrolase [Nonomuraea sp. PA05]TYB66851.1 alpha/beta hydrolase [Nonomuraea sp. PA05]